MIQTSTNVRRPPPYTAWTFKNRPVENRPSAVIAWQRSTDRLVRPDCDSHRLQLDRFLSDLEGELKGRIGTYRPCLRPNVLNPEW